MIQASRLLVQTRDGQLPSSSALTWRATSLSYCWLQAGALPLRGDRVRRLFCGVCHRRRAAAAPPGAALGCVVCCYFPHKGCPAAGVMCCSFKAMHGMSVGCNSRPNQQPPRAPRPRAARMPRWDPSRARTLQLDISYTRRGGPAAAAEGRPPRRRPQVSVLVWCVT